MKHRHALFGSLVCLAPMLACSGSDSASSATTPQGAAGAAGTLAGGSGSGGTSSKAGSGGVGGGTLGGTGGAAGTGPGGAAGAPATITIASLETAQTHVLPAAGLAWPLPDADQTLHLTGRRSFLALVALSGPAPKSPMLEALAGGMSVGTVPLAPPSALPSTEAGGPVYANDRYTATVAADWVKPGLSLRVTSAELSPSAPVSLEVGADTDFDMWTLPFYLFGANDKNAPAIAVTGKPDAASMAELREKWPIADVRFTQHPATRVDWPYIIVGPRDGAPAMRVDNKDQQKDGFAVMSAVLSTLSALRDANGESNTNNHYYAPLLMLDASGKYSSPGGGLGGGSRGTGDYDYAGIFIHEQGHAFGMPHAGEAFDKGHFPYPGGSLLGSAWGFDAQKRELLAPFIPKGADSEKGCLTDAKRQKDKMGRCVKQDPMQSGSGDQAPGYKYTMFSDYNAGVIQRYFEGKTTIAMGGGHAYDGGTLFVDSKSSTGYSRWDGIDHKRVEVAKVTTDKGLYEFDGGLPTKRGVPVHAIVFSLSNAATAGASQIYPPLSYTGNLLHVVDPTSSAEIGVIVPNTGDVPWYCHASGCDYTVRVTYADGSQAHVLMQGGFRAWFKPTEPLPATAKDGTDGDSYRVFGVNVPGDKPLAKIEVLDTPMGWNGVPAGAKVLLSRTP